MSRPRHLEVGEEGEEIAAEFLARAGWDIVARNSREKKLGELDIVATREDVLAFVEVKSRSIADEFDPTVAMNHNKMRKFVNASRAWLVRNESFSERFFPRLDVITVVDGRVAEHLEDAFEAPGG